MQKQMVMVKVKNGKIMRTHIHIHTQNQYYCSVSIACMMIQAGPEVALSIQSTCQVSFLFTVACGFKAIDRLQKD